MERLRGILFLTLLLAAASCQHTPVTPKPPVQEPYFKPGEYGGDAMPGTEWITSAFPSPNGQKMVVIRYWTPGRIGADPTKQLWIVNKDGSDPQLIAAGSAGTSWSPDGTKIAFTYTIFPDTYVFIVDLNTMNVTQLNGKKINILIRVQLHNPFGFGMKINCYCPYGRKLTNKHMSVDFILWI